MNAFPRLLAAAALFAAASLHAEVATWTNLDGQSMQAEFLARKGDYVSFRKEDGSKYLYPYAKLSEADRARVDTLARPASEAAEAAEAASSQPEATPARAATSGKIASGIGDKLVVVKSGSLAPAPADRLGGARYFAVYYSAHWCPPCRAFTPKLVDAYKEFKSRRPELEVIFVSSDKNADAMKDYMKEYKMTFPALRFDQKRSTDVLRRPKHERGIPNLVFMDADGKEISTSYTPDGEYRGPNAVLADIKKHLKL